MYLLRPESFIYTQPDNYDVIVRYKTPSGTLKYIDDISIPPQTLNSRKIGIDEVRPVKKSEHGFINYSFPGQSGNVHFNPRIISIRIIPLKE